MAVMKDASYGLAQSVEEERRDAVEDGVDDVVDGDEAYAVVGREWDEAYAVELVGDAVAVDACGPVVGS